MSAQGELLPGSYNPTADVFAVLLNAGSPVDIHAIRKQLPKMPEGTVSSTLTKLREHKLIDRTEGQRPALWHATAKQLPKALQVGRLAHPQTPGLHRNRKVGVGPRTSGDLLVTLPVGKRESITCTEKDARALFAALGRLFGNR